MGFEYEEGTSPPGSGNKSFGTATPGSSPQSEADEAFKSKQANLMGKGNPKSMKLDAMKRRMSSIKT